MLKEAISFKSLGTQINIQIIFDSEENREKAVADLREVKIFFGLMQRIFSRFDAQSELSLINNNLGQFQEASRDIIEVAREALLYFQKTGGYFDPRIIEILEKSGYRGDFEANDFSKTGNRIETEKITRPLDQDLVLRDGKDILFKRRMDFAGIAKGYITDKAADFLSKKGWENALVDSGGDMMSIGLDLWGSNWKVSLEGIGEEKLLLVLNRYFPAVATSGISKRKWENKSGRFHHLINPKNPAQFQFDTRTVTVIDRSAQEADIWAKTLFIMGRERGLKYCEKKKIKSLYVDCKGNIFLSSMAKESIAQNS